MTDMEMALMANIAVDMQDNKVDEVLDKIRAEIESIDTVKELDDSHMVIIKYRQMIKDEVLEIIDKHIKQIKGSDM